MQSDVKLKREQDIKLNDGEAKNKKCVNGSEQIVSETISQEVLQQIINNHSDSQRFKKKPAR